MVQDLKENPAGQIDRNGKGESHMDIGQVHCQAYQDFDYGKSKTLV